MAVQHYLNGDYTKVAKKVENDDDTMDEINDISEDPDTLLK